ncbi:Stk1 family PASTA domain-containing Ser/Thr kinase [Nocardioides daejeonensis]|uniref:Stk1 family PASTA domain-containing Ser/Thr kinase n=1 Tax=Nocardioides daejeonensis TaxID=1046556 RepID=UPI000D749933|nr:Stk1 family PASTA domain-containing Ser/Thr kinase [Nocardioides daejeonensis]
MTNDEPTLIGGRYELGELLGRGGMAEVRKGTDTRLGRVVAVKRLRTDLASDATFQARFRREAQSSASLNHPSIVAVYDTGEEMSPQGVAQPYIVMEYVAGRTLRDILREGRKILPDRALEITSGVLSALDYSHRAGIIHRDIKPANVMLTPGGDVKVMDFGIARAVSDASTTMTQTAAVVGTAQYLSPEQARGETVDSRSDVYSTGCLLYELLTGRPPFVGESPVAVAYQHVREPAVPPSAHDAELPPEIDAIVMKALAKRLEDRYQSAAAMRSDIERYLAGRPVSAPAVPLTPPPPVESTTYLPQHNTGAQPAAAVAEEEEPKSKAGMWILIGVLLLALLAGGIWFLNRGGDDDVKDVQVPSGLIGMSAEQAKATVEDAGFTAKITETPHETAKKGEVYDVTPEQGAWVPPDSVIELFVSTGPEPVTVPPVTSMQRDQAAKALRKAGLKVRFEEMDSDEEKGKVLSQDPTAGEVVPPGTVVTIKVSNGPKEVPYVVGMDRAAAIQAIEDAGFKAYVVETDDTTEPAGTVIDQSTEKGDTKNQGDEIRITVSTYVEPTEEPSPTESESPSDDTSPTDDTSPLLRPRSDAQPPASRR